MVEQADTRDLKSLAPNKRTGSIPVTGTIKIPDSAGSGILFTVFH